MAPSLINPVPLRRCCLAASLFVVTCCEKRATKLFGVGTLDHKESRKETEVASESEKVAKVRIVISINTRSARDK